MYFVTNSPSCRTGLNANLPRKILQFSRRSLVLSRDAPPWSAWAPALKPSQRFATPVRCNERERCKSATNWYSYSGVLRLRTLRLSQTFHVYIFSVIFGQIQILCDFVCGFRKDCTSNGKDFGLFRDRGQKVM